MSWQPGQPGMPGTGPSGMYREGSYERQLSRNEKSTSHKIKNVYWTTKQAVMQRLGRKEDEHVVASDSELDAKLELFKSIQVTCADLLRVIDRYQERLCALSQAENEMGRFLKSKSSQDKTQAGKMMCAVGKSLSFASQQRLALRQPLCRLYQEVETFRYRAISDTLLTIQRMESTRTDYRGALLWMKNQSDCLDPDEFKRLEKFRKVQVQVRKTKEKFDQLKLDSMQKVDLLAASRCNMCSHVLAAYQQTLMQFWEKTSRTMNAVAESFKGYQFYEFNMLKDLVDESRKLADSGTSKSGDEEGEEGSENDDEMLEDLEESSPQVEDLLCLDEINDVMPVGNQSHESVPKERPLIDILLDFNSDGENHREDQSSALGLQSDATFQERLNKLDEIFLKEFKDDPDAEEVDTEDMVPLPTGGAGGGVIEDKSKKKKKVEDNQQTPAASGSSNQVPMSDLEHRASAPLDALDKKKKGYSELDSRGGGSEDLLGTMDPGLTPENDPANFLDQLLSTAGASGGAGASEWGSLFDGMGMSGGGLEESLQPAQQQQEEEEVVQQQKQQSGISDFMPSALLDMTSGELASLQLHAGAPSQSLQQFTAGGTAGLGGFPSAQGAPGSLFYPAQTPSAPLLAGGGPPLAGAAAGTPRPPAPGSAAAAAESSRWLNLFADLDPLGNPDSIGKKEGQISDA